MDSGLSREEIIRYSRHLLIPEIGEEGQRKLKASSVLIVGTGGLGSPAALYLAAAGVGHIGLVDDDVVAISNLQRQVIFGTGMVGRSKVESARQRLVDLNPSVQVDVFKESFVAGNAVRIATGYDMLVDGTDNIPSRLLINDLCVLLGKPDIYAAVYRFEGQVSVFYPTEGPCYRCMVSKPPAPWQVPSGAEGGILGVLPGIIGTIQATETLKLCLGFGSTLVGRLLLVDARDLSFEFIRLKKNPSCTGCGSNSRRIGLIEDDKRGDGVDYRRRGDLTRRKYEIGVSELAGKLQRKAKILLLDVREPQELSISHLAGAKNIPLGQLAKRYSELDPTLEIIVFCRSGTRSRHALELLVNAGFKRVKTLTGGINAWAGEVDPSMPVY